VTDIPLSHPRYHSLKLRERLLKGLKAGLASEAGLLAHGRGEAFDYLIGEASRDFAIEAIAVASALLVSARRPVFSVNGNSASLAGAELVALAAAFEPLTLEVNLFHHSPERSARIAEYLHSLGASRVVESASSAAVALPGVESPRKNMSPDGLAGADVVAVALEDGDRCRALVEAGRTVIAIDLNPMSRTAQMAHVSITDELTRAVNLLTEQLVKDRDALKETLAARIAAYDNRSILERSIAAIRRGV
jgi:4-phosphopantoate--beta-alanine ligase